MWKEGMEERGGWRGRCGQVGWKKTREGPEAGPHHPQSRYRGRLFLSRIGHKDLAVEGEDDGVLREVNHVAHGHISRLPGTPKRFTAQVPALTL